MHKIALFPYAGTAGIQLCIHHRTGVLEAIEYEEGVELHSSTHHPETEQFVTDMLAACGVASMKLDSGHEKVMAVTVNHRDR